ncbi:MAG: hypothetical protein R3313_01060 [Candidatus Saccharimonadales bacterium]|nr:hypothetical protein [Candidatus Saccharimonadales bacterium]
MANKSFNKPSKLVSAMIVLIATLIVVGRVLVINEKRAEGVSGNLFNMSDIQAFIGFIVLMAAFFIPMYYLGALTNRVDRKKLDLIRNHLTTEDSYEVDNRPNGWRMALTKNHIELQEAYSMRRLNIPYTSVESAKAENYISFRFGLLIVFKADYVKSVKTDKIPGQIESDESKVQPIIKSKRDTFFINNTGELKYYDADRLLVIEITPGVGTKRPSQAGYRAIAEYINERSG